MGKGVQQKVSFQNELLILDCGICLFEGEFFSGFLDFFQFFNAKVGQGVYLMLGEFFAMVD